MSPKKSGVASPVESSDKKIEKVLEFHESARFSIKKKIVKIYPPHHNPLISEWAEGELRGKEASHANQLLEKGGEGSNKQESHSRIEFNI